MSCVIGASFLHSTKSVALVIAHPDDESMFFAPALAYFRKNGTIISVLCISNGNQAGLGKIREKELLKACRVFQISSSRVMVIDHPEFQDGDTWDIPKLQDQIQSALKVLNPDTVITFDEEGVSSHPNHIAVHQAIKGLQREGSLSYRLLILKTVTLIEKFMSAVILPLELFRSLYLKRILIISNPLTSTWAAMRCHRSQLVWYRYVYLILSVYIFMNIIILQSP